MDTVQFWQKMESLIDGGVDQRTLAQLMGLKYGTFRGYRSTRRVTNDMIARCQSIDWSEHNPAQVAEERAGRYELLEQAIEVGEGADSHVLIIKENPPTLIAPNGAHVDGFYLVCAHEECTTLFVPRVWNHKYCTPQCGRKAR